MGAAAAEEEACTLGRAIGGEELLQIARVFVRFMGGGAEPGGRQHACELRALDEVTASTKR